MVNDTSIKKSKLANTIEKMSQSKEISDVSIWKSKTVKSNTWAKTLSVKLRVSDDNNLIKIVDSINSISDRKVYKESDIIRAMINFYFDNIDSNKSKLLHYVKVCN